jgi:hypothetical protein
MSGEFYQIICSGKLAFFPANSKAFHSKNIYTSPPSQEIINNFVYSCTHPINDKDMFHLDENEDITTKIVKVILVNNG